MHGAGRAAHPPCLLELAQHQEHLIATRASSFGERCGGHAVAVGQQLLGGLGRQGLSRQLFFAVFCRRRLFGFGLDSAVEDSVGAAPLAVNADRAASSDEISEFACSMRPSMDWMSCWSEGMTADRTGGRGSLTDEVQARPVARATIRPGWRATRSAGPFAEQHI